MAANTLASVLLVLRTRTFISLLFRFNFKVNWFKKSLHAVYVPVNFSALTQYNYSYHWICFHVKVMAVVIVRVSCILSLLWLYTNAGPTNNCRLYFCGCLFGDKNGCLYDWFCIVSRRQMGLNALCYSKAWIFSVPLLCCLWPIYPAPYRPLVNL